MKKATFDRFNNPSSGKKRGASPYKKNSQTSRALSYKNIPIRKLRPAGKRRSFRSKRIIQTLALASMLIIICAAMVLVGVRIRKDRSQEYTEIPGGSEQTAAEEETVEAVSMTRTTKTPAARFQPYATEQTNPSHYIQYTEINVNGTTLTDPSQYRAEAGISFDSGSEYTSADGIVTFRGNNFRDSAAIGYADMSEYSLTKEWSHTTGGLSYGGTSWTGSGWTGQPLMAVWPEETKAVMNMYDWAREKDGLVEVIYACMDGYIYFLELETGEPTRDPLYLGFTFKGAGALDPRGYPIMYLGAGYDSNNGTARAFIINLLDCSVMYTFGNNDPFSLRGSLSYFDSSPLVDAETDTLIYPGENGILYLIRLNTAYDVSAGTLSISPDHIVKWHYYGNRSSVQSYWVGMEDSAAAYGGYLFMTDNGGNLMCLDLNTLQLVWVQDVLDDSNSTPVLSLEDGHLYLYVSTSFRLGWRSYSTAEVPIWKIDAENGKIVWKHSYECFTDDGVSGGVQSTIALGREELSDHLYVTVAKTGTAYGGVLACINKETGEVEWEHESYYAWSSPVCVYNEDGTGRVLYCSCGGKMYLLDGNTGEVCDTLELSNGAIEASPAVYGSYAVVGTRDCRIWGVKLA